MDNKLIVNLTDTEWRVVKLICDGVSNKGISEKNIYLKIL